MGDTKINYESLVDGTKVLSDRNDLELSYEIDDTPRNSGIMIHTVPEVNKGKYINTKFNLYLFMYACMLLTFVLFSQFKLDGITFKIWIPSLPKCIIIIRSMDFESLYWMKYFS